MYGPGTQLVGVLGQAALLAIGGVMVAHHSLTIGDLFAFFLYLNRFFAPIQLLVQQYNTYQQGQASVLKLRTLLETEPDVKEAVDARSFRRSRARSSSTRWPSATTRPSRSSTTSA